MSSKTAFANSNLYSNRFRAFPTINAKAKFVAPDKIKIGGWLGHRFDLNATQRMMNLSIDEILAGYRKKPGEQAWVGEHIGKFIHAATLTWVQTQNPAIKARIDYAVSELIKAQESDGYLGTYIKENRFGLYNGADWDVWSHKYCIIGLLTYYQFTGNQEALKSAKAAADLVIKTFAQEKSLNEAGAHEGMAATSILEPIVLLYLLSGDAKYLDFCDKIVAVMGEPKGSKIIDGLNQAKAANKISNGKAYEMLSNLVGLCEYAKVRSNPQLLNEIERLYDDIAQKRLYITGTSSSHEHFQADYHLPHTREDSIGETCVTTTWIQLSQSLLALTANVKYANEIEKSIYNQLTAAQNLNGNDWCYYTPLEGKKLYDKHVTCCHSSGPRGLAISPLSSFFTTKSGKNDFLHINSFENAKAEIEFDSNAKIEISIISEFPKAGKMSLEIRNKGARFFGIKIRAPEWAQKIAISNKAKLKSGWFEIAPRKWKDKEKVFISFSLSPKFQSNPNYNIGKSYATYGPFVLARIENGSKEPASINGNLPILVPEPSNSLSFTANDGSKFLTFADAGSDGAAFMVWI